LKIIFAVNKKPCYLDHPDLDGNPPARAGQVLSLATE